MKRQFPSIFQRVLLIHWAGSVALLALGFSLWLSSAWAIDPPHNTVADCGSCHMAHHSVGTTLTTRDGNGNLCMSCHTSGGSASGKAFASVDQALTWPGAGTNAAGTSHRWDAGAAGRLQFIGGAVTPSTGTITPSGVYTGYYARTYTLQILNPGAVGVAQFSWSASAFGGGAGTNLTGTNVLLDAGVYLSFADGTNTSFSAGDQWNLYVRPDLRNPTNTDLLVRLLNGAAACSTCHDQHSEAMQPFDLLAQPYTTNLAGTFIGTNRHFMRIANNTHQMCNDCHAPRVVTNAIGGSHPVGIYFATNAYYKRPGLLPVEVGTTNLGCLTCHKIHYAKRTSGDLGDGKLLQTNSVTLCTDCHTLANTASAHFVTTNNATLWPGPGGNYGSLMPARTDMNDRGTCLNCHAVHGWPDAANPTNHYPRLLADYQENFCYTCHGTNAAAGVKKVQADFAATYHHPVANNDPLRRSGRSVECVDCHNPHKAEAGSHNYTNTATAFRNNVTNTPSLKGVDGVYVNYTSLTNYQVITSNRFVYIPDTVGVTNECQICFKCHTGYGFPSYAAGVANFTTNSVTVTGVGTDWTTNMIGMWLGRSNDTRLSVITNVLNATNLAVMPAFSGSTMPTQSYVILNITAGLTPIYWVNTVSFTNNGNIVAGVNTAWSSGLVGTWIYNSNNPAAVYKIIAVTATNRLTITPAYVGITASGQNYGISGDTDLAQEFSPMNRSGHPIMTGLTNYLNSASPRALVASQMVAPWNSNLGTQTMLCSDCHDTQTTNYVATAAQGPHGSAYQYLLRGPNGNNWPTNTLANFATSWCVNCHSSARSANSVHSQNKHNNYPCYDCHIVVPHGGKVGRLIGNRNTMPARYAWQNNLSNMQITSFRKTTAAAYLKDGVGNCSAACDTSAHPAITGGDAW